MSKISTVSFIMMLKKKVLHVTFYVITDDINFFGNPPETAPGIHGKAGERIRGILGKSSVFYNFFFCFKSNSGTFLESLSTYPCYICQSFELMPFSFPLSELPLSSSSPTTLSSCSYSY